MLDLTNEEGTTAIFHEDEGIGYFFLYRSETNDVIKSVRLYLQPTAPLAGPEDIDIFWSLDESRAGVTLWGRMRALLSRDKEEVCFVRGPDSPAIDEKELDDFPEYLDRRKFLDSRKRYWNKALLEAHPEIEPSDQPLPLTDTRFLIAASDSQRRRVAVFEDEGETGDLYLYSKAADEIQCHLHIYDRSGTLPISKGDVEVRWSNDDSKCAVAIWGKFCGVMDLEIKREKRVWLEDRDTPGINDKAWLRGFEPM